MENYIWSLDVSTTNVGSALWNEKGKLVELKHLELKIDREVLVENRDIHKADIFLKYCLEYKEKIKNDLNGRITEIFIEAPLQNTPVNINTTAILLGFNGIARYILYQVFDLIPLKISVYDSRKLFCTELVKTSYKKGEKVEVLSFPKEYVKEKKLYIWEKVCKLEPQIEWLYKRTGSPKDMCFDMADSYAVGVAGLKILGILE